MKESIADEALVARCGLYCGACGRYRRGKCPGCRENARAGWCMVRACCQERGYASCAECGEFPDVQACKRFNNPMAKLFALLFRSNRAAGIEQIRRLGLRGHAQSMAGQQRQSLKRS